jgi:RNA polymerase sigma factor (sigma-70 family)
VTTAAEFAAGAPGDDPRSDAELISEVRGGAEASRAFGVLYARHQVAARGLARQLARSSSDADDLVAGAFTRMLEVLSEGGGPSEAFRAYLLTSVRHQAYDRTRSERRLQVTENIGDVTGIDPAATVVPFQDSALAGLERSLAARAFATLPERWQAVLWHLEIEGDAAADIAPLFGLTANAVSALGYRAREGLRQAYLQEHLASGSGRWDRRHRDTGERLGAYTRGGLSRRDATRVEEHLAECEECRALAGELREVNSGILRSAVAPLVIGAGLIGYLATRGGAVTGRSASTGHRTARGGVRGMLGALGSLAVPPVARRRPGLLPDPSRTVFGAGVMIGALGLAGAVGVATVVLGRGRAPTRSLPVSSSPEPAQGLSAAAGDVPIVCAPGLSGTPEELGSLHSA